MSEFIGPLARTCKRCEWAESDCACPDGGLYRAPRADADSDDIAMGLIVDGNIGDIGEARAICAKHPGSRADKALEIMAEFEDYGWQAILGEYVGVARHVARTGQQPRDWL